VTSSINRACQCQTYQKLQIIRFIFIPIIFISGKRCLNHDQSFKLDIYKLGSQGKKRCFTFETIYVSNLCLFEECDSKAKDPTDHYGIELSHQEQCSSFIK
jgi:hypothetical protein